MAVGLRQPLRQRAARQAAAGTSNLQALGGPAHRLRPVVGHEHGAGCEHTGGAAARQGGVVGVQDRRLDLVDAHVGPVGGARLGAGQQQPVPRLARDTAALGGEGRLPHPLRQARVGGIQAVATRQHLAAPGRAQQLEVAAHELVPGRRV